MGWCQSQRVCLLLRSILFYPADTVDFSDNSNSWCDPFKTWQKAYSFDPVANLTADQAKLVLGGNCIYA